jgi:hypothetical protein
MPNINVAREDRPSFNEEVISFEKIKESLDKCPSCKGGTVMLTGTLQRSYTEEREHGMLIRLDAEREEAQHLDIIECLVCEKRFIIQYEDFPPVALKRTAHKRR